MGQTAVKTGSCFLRSQAIDGSCYGTDPATAEAEHKLHQRFLRLQELHRRVMQFLRHKDLLQKEMQRQMTMLEDAATSPLCSGQRQLLALDSKCRAAVFILPRFTSQIVVQNEIPVLFVRQATQEYISHYAIYGRKLVAEIGEVYKTLVAGRNALTADEFVEYLGCLFRFMEEDLRLRLEEITSPETRGETLAGRRSPPHVGAGLALFPSLSEESLLGGESLAAGGPSQQNGDEQERKLGGSSRTEEEDLADGCIFKPAPGTPDLATINAMSPLPVPEVKRRQMMPLLPCVGEPGRGFAGRAGSDSALVRGSLHSNSMFHPPHYTMTCGYDDDEDAPMVEPFRPPWQRRPSTHDSLTVHGGSEDPASTTTRNLRTARGGAAGASARPGFRRPYLEKQQEAGNNFNFDQRSDASDATFMSSPEAQRGAGAGAPRVSHELRSLGLTENAGVPERTPDVEVEVKMTSDGPPRRYSGGSRDYTPELFPVPQSSSEQEEYVSRALFQEISQMHDQVSSLVGVRGPGRKVSSAVQQSGAAQKNPIPAGTEAKASGAFLYYQAAAEQMSMSESEDHVVGVGKTTLAGGDHDLLLPRVPARVSSGSVGSSGSLPPSKSILKNKSSWSSSSSSSASLVPASTGGSKSVNFESSRNLDPSLRSYLHAPSSGKSPTSNEKSSAATLLKNAGSGGENQNQTQKAQAQPPGTRTNRGFVSFNEQYNSYRQQQQSHSATSMSSSSSSSSSSATSSGGNSLGHRDMYYCYTSGQPEARYLPHHGRALEAAGRVLQRPQMHVIHSSKETVYEDEDNADATRFPGAAQTPDGTTPTEEIYPRRHDHEQEEAADSTTTTPIHDVSLLLGGSCFPRAATGDLHAEEFSQDISHQSHSFASEEEDDGIENEDDTDTWFTTNHPALRVSSKELDRITKEKQRRRKELRLAQQQKEQHQQDQVPVPDEHEQERDGDHDGRAPEKEVIMLKMLKHDRNSYAAGQEEDLAESPHKVGLEESSLHDLTPSLSIASGTAAAGAAAPTPTPKTMTNTTAAGRVGTDDELSHRNTDLAAQALQTSLTPSPTFGPSLPPLAANPKAGAKMRLGQRPQQAQAENGEKTWTEAAAAIDNIVNATMKMELAATPTEGDSDCPSLVVETAAVFTPVDVGAGSASGKDDGLKPPREVMGRWKTSEKSGGHSFELILAPSRRDRQLSEGATARTPLTPPNAALSPIEVPDVVLPKQLEERKAQPQAFRKRTPISPVEVELPKDFGETAMKGFEVSVWEREARKMRGGITFCVFAADRKVVVGGTSYRMDDVKCICEGFRSPCFFEENFAALNVSPGCLLTLVFVDGEARVDLQFSSTVIRDRVLAYLQKYLPPVVFISGDENL